MSSKEYVLPRAALLSFAVGADEQTGQLGPAQIGGQPQLQRCFPRLAAAAYHLDHGRWEGQISRLHVLDAQQQPGLGAGVAHFELDRLEVAEVAAWFRSQDYIDCAAPAAGNAVVERGSALVPGRFLRHDEGGNESGSENDPRRRPPATLDRGGIDDHADYASTDGSCRLWDSMVEQPARAGCSLPAAVPFPLQAG